MAGIQLKRIVFIISLAIISNLYLSSIHYMYGGGFKSSRGGTIFVMGNLVEMGVIDTYLAENCDLKYYNLCQYKDSLPNNFLWARNSPLYKTGGWESNEEEYGAIINDIMITPKYLKTVIYKSLLLTFKQFFHFETGEAGKPTTRVKVAINTIYPNEYHYFIQSRQSKQKLNFDFINFIQIVIVAACFFVYILVFYFQKLTVKIRLLIVLILIGLLINAWLCGTFSGVYPRYQARLIWLVPLPLFLYAMETEWFINLNFKILSRYRFIRIFKGNDKSIRTQQQNIKEKY